MFGIAAVVAILSMSFTVASHNGAFTKKSVSPTSYTCRASTDYDKITDITVIPNVVYDNTGNTGSAGLPPTADCFSLNHQPTSAFSCNDTQTHFCCAVKGTACTGGFKVTLHYKS